VIRANTTNKYFISHTPNLSSSVIELRARPASMGNSRSRSGSVINIGYFEIWGVLGRMIAPANYDNCRASAAGFDWCGVGEMAGRRAAKPVGRFGLCLQSQMWGISGHAPRLNQRTANTRSAEELANSSNDLYRASLIAIATPSTNMLWALSEASA
jgi:hypothetical protein